MDQVSFFLPDATSITPSSSIGAAEATGAMPCQTDHERSIVPEISRPELLRVNEDFFDLLLDSGESARRNCAAVTSSTNNFELQAAFLVGFMGLDEWATGVAANRQEGNCAEKE